MNASTASTVGYAEVGGADCALRTALVVTSMPTSVLKAEVGGTERAPRAAIVSAPMASTML